MEVAGKANIPPRGNNFDEENADLLVGKNAVVEALTAGKPLNKIMVAEGAKGKTIEKIITLAREQGVPFFIVPGKKIATLAQGVNAQGVLAFCAPFPYAELEDLLAKNKEEPFFLILDELKDPHNLGALLRSGDAVGLTGIIIPKRRSVPLTGAVVKTSAGAAAHVPVVRADNLVATMKILKERGIWIVGADMSGEQIYSKANLTGPLALALGSEGKGLGRLVRENCDFLVRLPMKGKINSLNVSVAGSILLYEIFRQRSADWEVPDLA